MFYCSLNVPETNLKSFAESRYLSGSYFILLGNDPENGNSPCSKHTFVLSFSYMDCEIRHEILFVWTLGAHLIHFILFSVGSFLKLLFAIGNVAIWEGTMTPSPPWIRHCL